VPRYSSFVNVKSAAVTAGLALFGILEWLFGHTIYAACVAFLEVRWQMSDGQMTATLAQYAIPLAASGLIAWFIFWAGQRHGRAAGLDIAIAPSIKGDAPLSLARLNIAFGQDKNYVREDHFENGLFRRVISVAVVNNNADDIYNCNIKLTQASPQAMIGDSNAALPIFFIPNFDLSSGKGKYVEIISFVESGWQTQWQRDSVRIHAGIGGFSGGWTTLSPLPTQDNPSILTLEVFASAIAPSQFRLKIWVDETLGRKLCASIA
jgi:hypothetical protein